MLTINKANKEAAASKKMSALDEVDQVGDQVRFRLSFPFEGAWSLCFRN